MSYEPTTPEHIAELFGVTIEEMEAAVPPDVVAEAAARRALLEAAIVERARSIEEELAAKYGLPVATNDRVPRGVIGLVDSSGCAHSVHFDDRPMISPTERDPRDPA